MAVLVLVGSMAPIAMLNAETRGPTQQGATGNVQSGRQLFLGYSCYACHGYAAHGGGGPRLAPSRFATAAGFTAFVRNPPRMPPYTAKVLSDQQLADIWAYIQSLPRSPAAKDIPLLSQILNEK